MSGSTKEVPHPAQVRDRSLIMGCKMGGVDNLSFTPTKRGLKKH